MKNLTVEKVGVEEILEMKRSRRQSYVVIPGDVVTTFDLQPGDRLRVKIKEVIRTG